MTKKSQTRISQKKELWKLAFAKSSMFQAKRTCEFLIKNAGQIDLEIYDTTVAGIFILYARAFGQNEGVGSLRKKFCKFADPKQKHLHDLILNARNHLIAHTNANYPLCDEKGNEIDKLLKLELIVNFTNQDGMADARTQIIVPRLEVKILNLIEQLCEESIHRIAEDEKNLIKLLYEDHPMQEGRNPINIFDEN